jgi:hypothetical protein
MGRDPNLGHIATLSGSRNNDLLYDFTAYVHIHFTMSNYLYGFIFLPQLSLFPTPGVWWQSLWPNLNHDSKELENTAPKLFSSYHERYDGYGESICPLSWHFRAAISNSPHYYVTFSTLSCDTYPQITPSDTILCRIRNAVHRNRETIPRNWVSTTY